MERYTIQELRLMTGLSQTVFAKEYGIPVSTLRKWEQGESQTASYLIRLIAQTIPGTDKTLYKISGIDHKTYYYDENKRCLYDSIGNTIHVQIDLATANMNNLSIYVAELFEAVNDGRTRFTNSLELDKKYNINWVK